VVLFPNSEEPPISELLNLFTLSLLDKKAVLRERELQGGGVIKSDAYKKQISKLKRCVVVVVLCSLFFCSFWVISEVEVEEEEELNRI